ncbi:MAG: class I SAM-dependent methyltransferase, partial [Chloroflexi bacterium]|nr:class I SAM-dependent methyltransferase [Chloroflexota bacterium]
GASFAFYSRDQLVIVSEPDPHMLKRARSRAAQLSLNVEFHPYPAEALAFPDRSMDSVVSSLVLCTVTDQAKSLQEVRRLLKPGGRFRFVEHVRGEGFLGRIHDLLTPLWQWLGAGCQLNRRTVEALEAAGFEVVEVRRKRLFLLPFVAGVARAKQ